MKKTLHILLIALTCCEGCKKDDPKPLTELEKLPAATQVGKNTFGCLVNGKAFIPASPNDITPVYQLGILDLRCIVFSPDLTIKFVLLEDDFGELNVKSYPLNKYTNSSASVSKQLHDTSYCYYQKSNTFSGNLSISKFDRTNFIISGIFEFSSVSSGCDTLKITNGRFDLKYIP